MKHELKIESSISFNTGKYYWKNGKRYEGGFQNGKRHGKGTMFTGDGDRFLRRLEYFVGRCRNITFSENRYDGEWEAGKPVGSGVLTQFSVKVPVDWVDGKPVPRKPHVKRPTFAQMMQELS